MTKHYVRKNGTLIAGEPRHGTNYMLDTLFCGEDVTHNRLKVTVEDWHKLLSEGWRIDADISKKEVKKAIKMLQEIYSRMK